MPYCVHRSGNHRPHGGGQLFGPDGRAEFQRRLGLPRALAVHHVSIPAREWRALAFYTAGGIAAGVAFGLLSAFIHMQLPLIGASGSVLAVIGACAYLFPEQQVLFILFLIPIRVLAILLGVLYLLTVVGEHNLSNAAHLGGMVFGVMVPWLLGPAWTRFTRQMHVRKLRRETVEEEHEEEVVDQILDKVHAQGMHSLTWRERRILRKATERQRQRDLEVAKRKG
jgi:hypothetical protein